MSDTEQQIIDSTKKWVKTVVIDLNFCPFARREIELERVRFEVASVDSLAELLSVLHAELQLLIDCPDIETTLLILPNILQAFDDYNQFLTSVDGALNDLDLIGVFQVASFHPEYQFAGTMPEDIENYTNKSPYPMLHLLREESVERAVRQHPDAEGIPAVNIETLKSLGKKHIVNLFECGHHEY